MHRKKLKEQVQITPFLAKHQIDIDEMMERIALEFEQNILTENYKKIIDLSHFQNCKFWVAISNEKVVGTIGLFELENQNSEIKKMFVSKSFRGFGVSNLLLNSLIDKAKEKNSTQIYLGTMTQFIAAQRFYEKNGFKEISQSELPHDFIINPLDRIFYVKKIG